MTPEENARLQALIRVVANENNRRKRKKFASELESLLDRERVERYGKKENSTP